MGRSQRNSRPPKMVTEATFDVEARKDWLQGFRKRKRERRLTGLAHGALKARKQKLADRAARRSMRPPPAPEPVVLDEAPATPRNQTIAIPHHELWSEAASTPRRIGVVLCAFGKWCHFSHLLDESFSNHREISS